VRILFLASRFPYPPLRGDQVRAYHQIRLLARRHQVTLVAVARTPPAPEARAHMQRFCHRLVVEPLTAWQAVRGLGPLLGGDPRPLQVLLYRRTARAAVARLVAAGAADVIHVQLVRPAGLVPAGCHVPVVVDLVDVLSSSYGSQARIGPGWKRPLLRFEARRLLRYERGLVAAGTPCVVVSERERERLGVAGGFVAVNPNGVDLEAFPFTPGEGRAGHVVFVGNLGYPPNADAIVWFASAVWPLVRAAVPAARLSVVGPRAPARVRALARRAEGIEVTGAVPDVHARLRAAEVAVAPLRAGGGVQNKVLEAMASGTPVVATPTAVAGLTVEPDEHCLVADAAPDFARLVCLLLEQRGIASRLAHAARARVAERYSWDESVRGLERVYHGACANPVAGVSSCGAESRYDSPA
jgi:sugar transferase (PEP-CTERM/EpsH1 system associated)